MIRRVIDIVLYTSIIISFGAAAITLRTYFIINKDPHWHFVVFTFFSTLFIYNLTKLIPIWSVEINKKENQADRHQWNSNNKKLLTIITLTSFVICGYLAFKLSVKQQILLAHLGLISGLYAMPIFTGKPLRALPLLKIFLIAYVWAVTSVLPALDFSVKTVNIALENFFFILAITIPFDIRDYGRDQAEGITTIPFKFGIQQSKWVAVFCIFISTVFSFMILNDNLELLITTLLNLLFIPVIVASNEKRGEYFYLGVIDGLLILRLIAFI